jgi:hypothetical protein
MAHTKVTKTHSQNTGVANTFSYSGSFDVFKGSEVVVLLDGIALTLQAGTIDESASPREYTVDTTAKTVHIGGADLSSGIITIRPETDLGNPTPRATYAPGASVTSEDLNNNQLQLMRKAMEYNEQKLASTGGTMTGDLHLGQNVNLTFEGSAEDDYETTLTVTNPTADRTITLPNVTGTVVTTGDTGSVATGMVADDAITTDKLANAIVSDITANTAKVTNATHTGDVTGSGALTIASGAVNSDKIANGAVTTDKIAADAIDGTKIADDSINSEHYVDGSIDTAHIASAQVTDAKLASNSVTTGKITDANVTTVKIADSNITLAKLASDLKQTTISDSDTQLPTSGAVVDYVAAQLQPFGGFEAVATELAFPNTQPASGVAISISDAGGVVFNGSGSSTTGRTVGGTTVTINNAPSSLNGETLVAGVGLIVTSTGSGQIYNYHKILGKETDIKQLSDDINDFNARYRVNAGEPGSSNDEGDLVYDTTANKMKVYDGSSWGEVASTGEFKFLFLCPAGGSGAPTINGSIATYDLRQGSNSGTAADVTIAAQLLVSVNGVIQKANSGTSAPAEGFALVDANTIVFGTNLPTGADVFIIQIGSSVTVPTPGDGTVTATKIGSGAVETAKIADSAVTTAKVADDAVTLAKLAGLARGKIIYGDSSGNPAALSLGSSGQTLVSDGTDISWGDAAAGATGGGSDKIFWENGQTVTTNYTITNNYNAMSAGPITINNGISVTIGTGENWTIV